MSDLPNMSDLPRSCDFAARLRLLSYRCWNRGTQEVELILGTFADDELADLDDVRLGRLEALLDCTDPDLFDWIICGICPPPEHDHDLMRTLRAFSDRRRRPSENAAVCLVHR
jgi:antitoxin CptB